MNEHTLAATLIKAKAEPSPPRAVSHEYHGCITIRGIMKKALACLWEDQRIANPQSSLEEIEEMYSSLPLHNVEIAIQRVKSSTLERPRQKRDPQKEQANETTTSSSHVEKGEEAGQERGETQPPSDTPPSTIHTAKSAIFASPLQLPMLKPDGQPAMSLGELRGAYQHEADAIGVQQADEDFMSQKMRSHVMMDVESGKHIGVWVPDVLGTEAKRLVHCLVISVCRRYVWCLGLVPTSKEDEYSRVGLAYFHYDGWRNSGEGEMVTVDIV
jgi:hypothetical protein